MAWGDDPNDLLQFHPPFRSGDNDQPSLDTQETPQYLFDVFNQMLRSRDEEVHVIGMPGPLSPAYVSPVTSLDRVYDVTLIDRNNGRQHQEPLAEFIATRASLETAMRQQLTDMGAILGLPI